MIKNWPSELPRPERDTWQMQTENNRIKRQGDGGSPWYKRKYSRAAKFINLSLLLDRDLKAVFDEFYEDTTASGTINFYMPDPTTDGWSILDQNGRSLLNEDNRPLLISSTVLCSFGDETPIETVVGVGFRKSFSLVVYP